MGARSDFEEETPVGLGIRVEGEGDGGADGGRGSVEDGVYAGVREGLEGYGFGGESVS